MREVEAETELSQAAAVCCFIGRKMAGRACLPLPESPADQAVKHQGSAMKGCLKEQLALWTWQHGFSMPLHIFGPGCVHQCIFKIRAHPLAHPWQLSCCFFLLFWFVLCMFCFFLKSILLNLLKLFDKFVGFLQVASWPLRWLLFYGYSKVTSEQLLFCWLICQCLSLGLIFHSNWSP